MEIERKYLVPRLPDDYRDYPAVEMEQCYLCASPTVRVRRAGDAYVLTVKERLSTGSTAIHNREEEFSLSPDAYGRLKAKCDGNVVEKTRYRIDLRRQQADGLYTYHVAELDVFHGRNEGLALVEVEFSTTAEAEKFVPPAWFGEEVSADPHYSNSYLALGQLK